MIVEDLKLDPSDFEHYPWETYLQESSSNDYFSYAGAFGKKGREFVDASDEKGAHVCHFLWLMSNLETRFSHQEQEYTPTVNTGLGRSITLYELSEEDLYMIKYLYENTNNDLMKARFGDIIWIRDHDHTVVREVLDIYLKMVEEGDYLVCWHENEKTLKRSLAIALQLNDSDLIKKVVDIIQEKINFTASIDNNAKCLYLMQILKERNLGDNENNGAIALDLAKQFRENKNFHLARGYLQLASAFYNAAKKTESHDDCKFMIADCWREESVLCTEGEKPSYFMACKYMTIAISAFRNIKADSAIINPLIEKLKAWQPRIKDEMKVYKHDLDIREQVDNLKEHVSKLNLYDAIKFFTLGHDIIDVNKLAGEIKAMTKDFPMTFLIHNTHIAGDGRTVGFTPGVLGAAEEDAAIKERCYIDAQLDWQTRAISFIAPCRDQILDTHHPSKFDLAYLVFDNPFVEEGHEEIILEGIHAGFWGIMIKAAHLLIPQIENGIRNILKINGINEMNLLSDGTQEYKNLDVLLSMDETKAIFDENYIFELKGLLCKKEAFNTRNDLCHGIIDDRSCYTYPILNIWWLVLRILAVPIFIKQIKSEE